MALIIADRVQETTTTTGTGALALLGAVAGHQAFDDVCANGDTCYYAVWAVDGNGNPTGEWEAGLGTFTDTDTLTRTTPQASSNAGAVVNFAAGTKHVILSATAGYLATKVTATLDTDNTLAADSDTRVPSQKAIKAYVDALPAGGGSWQLQWGPLQAEVPPSNYATLDSRNNHPVLDFDATTGETIYFHGVLPDDYAGGGVTVSIWCAATSATSGTIGWLVALERINTSSLDIDADSFASDQTVTATTVPGTSGQVLKLSVNISNGANMDSLAAGELFRLRITRDVANDTAAGDAELLRVLMVEQ